ncbi:CENP-B N-terminal DNA-binding domain [Popillia japonica]|uniref:CENP-B N-terminal DNA-binding domain n=1 Tax=Popillia japonica TaxID=7064 RepID=A0AAW1IXE7_POPJA
MVRNYKRKRIEPAPSENNYANAIQAVAGGMGLRKAAAVYGVKHNTLFYRIKTAESKVAAEEREGFRKTGIWPLNKLIFSDNDYDCAFVTDQSEVTELQTEKRTPPDNIENQTPNIRLATMSNETPSTSKGMLLDTPTNSPSVNCIAPPHVTPEDIRPLPKAPIRKQSVLKRKAIRSRVLTESPEKNKIEEETVNRERKKKLVEERKLRKDLLLLNKRLKAKTDYEGSSEESEIEVVYAESDGSLSFCQESTSEDATSSGTEFLIGDLVLVKFSTKKTTK